MQMQNKQLTISFNSVNGKAKKTYDVEKMNFPELLKNLKSDFPQFKSSTIYYLDDNYQSQIDDIETLEYAKANTNGTIQAYIKVGELEKTISTKSFKYSGPKYKQGQFEVNFCGLFEQSFKKFIEKLYCQFGHKCFFIKYADEDGEYTKFQTKMEREEEEVENWEMMLSTMDIDSIVQIGEVIPPYNQVRKVTFFLPPKRREVLKMEPDLTFEEIRDYVFSKFNQKYFTLILDKWDTLKAFEIMNEQTWRKAKLNIYHGSVLQIQESLPYNIIKIKVKAGPRQLIYQINKSEDDTLHDFKELCTKQLLSSHKISSIEYLKEGVRIPLATQHDWASLKQVATSETIILISAAKQSSSSTSSKKLDESLASLMNSEGISIADQVQIEKSLWEQRREKEEKERKKVENEIIQRIRNQEYPVVCNVEDILKKEHEKREEEEDDHGSDSDSERSERSENSEKSGFQSFLGGFQKVVSTLLVGSDSSSQESPDEASCKYCPSKLGNKYYRKCRNDQCNNRYQKVEKPQKKKKNNFKQELMVEGAKKLFKYGQKKKSK